MTTVMDAIAGLERLIADLEERAIRVQESGEYYNDELCDIQDDIQTIRAALAILEDVGV